MVKTFSLQGTVQTTSENKLIKLFELTSTATLWHFKLVAKDNRVSGISTNAIYLVRIYKTVNITKQCTSLPGTYAYF